MNNEKNEHPSNHLIESADLDFIADSKAAILLNDPRGSSILLYTVLGMVVFLLLWSAFASIDEVTQIEGRVRPSSSVQIIQSLEGGILVDMRVKEGQVVNPGDVLLRIDDTQARALHGQEREKYLSLLGTAYRLKAQIEGKPKVDFPKELLGYSDIIERETRLFKAQTQEFHSSIDTLQKSYDLVNKELNITRPLTKSGVMSQLDLLRSEREANELSGKLSEAKDGYSRDLLKQFSQTDAELSASREFLKGLHDRMMRTTLVAPVRGTVNNIRINTLGGVIKPGMDILDVVPFDQLIIEGHAKPSDIGFIRVNQKATVKFSAYDFALYGGLEGTVQEVSPSTSVDERGNPYYEIKLITPKSYLGSPEKPLPIIPGMTTQIDVLTGKKSILHYLMKPMLRQADPEREANAAKAYLPNNAS